VVSHDPLTIEIYGTIAIRALCYVLPALVFFAFDVGLPNLSKNVKARGKRHLPSQLSRDKLVKVTAIAVGNVALAILIQAALETVVTRVLHLRSLIKVTTILPLPLTIVVDILKGLVCRSVLSYLVHRYLLHTYDTPLKRWHRQWQHAIDVPFSLKSSYDHPVNYLLHSWLPAFLPAYLFRWHVLTWHAFLLIISLEEVFVFSGYAVLPSSIILSGMARRSEAHFDSVRNRGPVGNFGHLGILDFVFRTACQHEDDILDDVKSEAEKHRLQDRIDAAVQAALSKQHESSSNSDSKGKLTFRKPKANSTSADTDTRADNGNDYNDDTPEEGADSGPRRSGRRRLFKS
jgi:hypothetical protein